MVGVEGQDDRLTRREARRGVDHAGRGGELILRDDQPVTRGAVEDQEEDLVSAHATSARTRRAAFSAASQRPLRASR